MIGWSDGCVERTIKLVGDLMEDDGNASFGGHQWEQERVEVSPTLVENGIGY